LGGEINVIFTIQAGGILRKLGSTAAEEKFHEELHYAPHPRTVQMMVEITKPPTERREEEGA